MKIFSLNWTFYFTSFRSLLPQMNNPARNLCPVRRELEYCDRCFQFYTIETVSPVLWVLEPHTVSPKWMHWLRFIFVQQQWHHQHHITRTPWLPVKLLPHNKRSGGSVTSIHKPQSSTKAFLLIFTHQSLFNARICWTNHDLNIH